MMKIDGIELTEGDAITDPECDGPAENDSEEVWLTCSGLTTSPCRPGTSRTSRPVQE